MIPKNLRTLSLLLIVFLFNPSMANAAVYYVATNGSDTNPGTEALPWRTIQKAADMAIAGDTVRVRAGIYDKTDGTCGSPASGICGIKPKNSGTSGNPITFETYPGDSVVIDRAFVIGDGQSIGFYVFNKSHITIRGFEIRNTGPAGILVVELSNNIIIEKNHVHHINGAAGENVGAVRLEFCDFCTVKNNRIHDVTVAGDMGNQNSATVFTFNMSNGTIENNNMWNAANGIFHKRASGVKGAIMRNNLIHDTKLYGIRFSVAGTGDPPHIDHEVYQNIFYNVPTGIFASTGSTSTPSRGLVIYNNVLDVSTEAIRIEGYDDLKFWNNIFYTTGTAIKTVGDPSGNTMLLSNYNLFYPSANFTLDLGWNTARSYTSLSAWQTNEGYDLNSLNINPLFVNRGAGDYHLQTGSLAELAGHIGGTSSGTVVDMGAYPTGTGTVGPTTLSAPKNLSVK